MTEVMLTPDEAAILRAVLSQIVIRDRTGEVGILHGLERFVSTQLILNKQDRDILILAAKKLGLKAVSETGRDKLIRLK
jgi:hypothetical protein